MSTTLEQLSRIFATAATVKAVDAAVGSHRRVILSGLCGSATAMLLSRLKKHQKPYIIVADDPDAAGYIYHDLSRLCADADNSVKYFPSGYRRDIKYGQPDPPAQILRTEALDAWNTGKMRFLVTSPEALAEKVPAPGGIAAKRIVVKKGMEIPVKEIRQQLLDIGFRQTDYVYEPGQFAVRGSILDVYSYACPQPYRIDFFDTEVDSIRNFDVETQLSTETPDEVTIMPDMAAEEQNGGVSLLDFAGEDTVLFAADPQFVQQRIESIAASTLATEVDITGEGDPDALLKVVSPKAFAAAMQKMRTVVYGAAKEAAKASADTAEDAAVIAFSTEPQTLYHKNFDLIASSFARYHKEGYSIYLLSDNATQADRLKAIFAERREEAADLSFIPVSPTLHAGFADHRSKSCFFTDHQIFDRFHRYNLRSERARGGKLAMSLRELQKLEQGDFVVHADHGIGRFGGLIRTDVAGKTQEMIKLFYQNDDIILVNIHSLHKLSKYRGAEGVPPKLSKLGSGAWQRLKDRTKSKVKDIARDLIRLYAQRQQEKGFAFSPDTYLQHELEASFLYEDTPDQLRAVQDIKADMQSPRPMDRLVCGDVGFGKTEVAMRAAFLAVENHKQVAVLVPTTLLAQQHYDNFRDRFANWPVRIEMLSRFRSAKEQAQILEQAAEGKIDILIGTHKLLQSEVKLRDLGLLIVDEEHRFGVRHKERIKAMRADVDILTLTATPIPRTLNMAMSGMRDLSIIATPPARRLAVKTFVREYDALVVREAILRETLRGGQVYYLFNDVENIQKAADKLAELVPEARIAIGHGQMRERELERVMNDFHHQRFNVLVCTTIIETGIDIPTANTIIIERADHFGLAQLHQLRGRVGRSHHQAYAWLLTPHPKAMTTDAQKRLEAIASLEDLGAGFALATHDLEIRGAGELLGEDQSGQMETIGFSLYMELLENAVDALKAGREPSLEDLTSQQTEVELRMPSLLPDDFIPDVNTRLSFYKRIASAKNEQDLEEIKVELIDRFGRLPDAARNLLDIARLRQQAQKLGIRKLESNEKGGVIEFNEKNNVNPVWLIGLLQKQPQHFRLDGPTRLKFIQDLEERKTRMDWVRQFMRQLEENAVA